MMSNLLLRGQKTYISPRFYKSLASLSSSTANRFFSSSSPSSTSSEASSSAELKSSYDAIVIGAGHNGLVSAAYLQKAGLNTVVLERRHVIGGAAVTEELIPGFKFSRCSYVLSLLRPDIYEDLELKRHGLKIHYRVYNAFTPILEEPVIGGHPRSLLLSSYEEENYKQIAQFSEKDAKNFSIYEHQLFNMAKALGPLLDNAPVNLSSLTGSLSQKIETMPSLKALFSTGQGIGSDLPAFYELLTAPAIKVLEKWFESEPLKATLATDAVIGAMMSPSTPGSGYVLLHHVMGELEGNIGAWGYVEGGNGALSECIAKSAKEHGATILTEKPVSSVILDANNKACGVVLEDGTEIDGKIVLSNATPHVTYQQLVPENSLPAEFTEEVAKIDYTSPVTKINVAVDRVPDFLARPTPKNIPGPHHGCTIHLNSESCHMIEDAYKVAMEGQLHEKPMIEMCIPSALDPTISPEGSHVISLFTQYTPYSFKDGRTWDEEMMSKYRDIVFNNIEDYAPGFKDSVIGVDMLPPPELERIFGLTGGNIFHGAMSLDQLYFARPVSSMTGYRSPLRGLYLCGSGAHPGGGVMGAPGRNAAHVAIKDLKQKRRWMNMTR
ncbi:pyridine nucleotide-disulfide oxidoreductase domain-containing protein 2-like [Anneissia japonica]|uniref:pyridine nucleotide-disulfide oxidoreductase domain-containing protein 2-like n=1 Tax=Anneissia japonica TaxID=1529436 RepID=UPI001425B74A|nr:pyridine nucleotide-disulfide oxidoreductase domain-containing protein 2-like [Anneissia japonica]